jgi:hypothetical protein
MPRCQRTFQRLASGEALPGRGGTRWICPYCPDAEHYEAICAPDLLYYTSLAEAACRTDFGTPSDSTRSLLLLYGLRPECVLEAADRRYDIYLQHDSDPFQLRLQIGHEMFHRFCSQGRVFHWTHEMLACLVSVRLLRRHGMEEYAAQVEREYENQAQQLSVTEMRCADLTAPPYPTGLYGRAYVTGQHLVEAVGWPALCRLARLPERGGIPDLEKWREKLSLTEAERADTILGITWG